MSSTSSTTSATYAIRNGKPEFDGDKIIAEITVVDDDHNITLFRDDALDLSDPNARRQFAEICGASITDEHAPDAIERHLIELFGTLSNSPRPVSLRDLVANNPALRPPLIRGLLREGETMNVIAPPKANKSWIVTDMGLAVAAGLPWFGFETTKGDALIIDNELHRETSANRIPKVAEARGIDLDTVADHLFIENLRGRLKDIHRMASYFDAIDPGRFKLIILDALYRFMPTGSDENDNAIVANVYNLIDNYADRLKCAFALVHHASKGNQSDKSVTDVGSGAGSQSRAADSHLVLRQHEEDNVMVLDAAVRSWAPVASRCYRWEFPIWTPADDLDPTKLRRGNKRGKVKEEIEATVDPFADKPAEAPTTPADFVAKYLGTDPRSAIVITSNATLDGMSERQADRLLKAASGTGLCHRWKIRGDTKAHYATVPQAQEDGH